ncbi:MAG: tetratricopeptide repeat protein [Planctomycetes bacterium]|nr:tetratricopeptide repeat protein [Planctomycetota bacterium]
MVSLTHKRHLPGTVHDPDEIGGMPDRFVHPRFRLLQGDSNASLAEYSRMVQLSPEDPQAYGDRAMAYLNKGNYRKRTRHVSAWRQRCFDKAITDFTTAIRLAPKDASLYLWRGIAFRARGQLNKAIADLTEALRLEPEGPRAYVERSVAHQQKGEMDEAKADSAKAEHLAMSLW